MDAHWSKPSVRANDNVNVFLCFFYANLSIWLTYGSDFLIVSKKKN